MVVVFDQTNPVLVETDSGALLGFSDERSGAPEHRIRVIDVEDGGKLAGVSLSFPMPFRFERPTSCLVRTALVDTVGSLANSPPTSMVLRISRIDSLTGERVGETATILHDETRWDPYGMWSLEGHA